MKSMRSGVVCCCLFLSASLAAAQVAVTTYHNDNYRSGSNPNETTLTQSQVNVQTFGKLKTFSVQGYVYAQPLYVPGLTINGTTHNVVFIATEHDQVYAFDTATGAQLWQANLLRSANPGTLVEPFSSDDVNCTDLVPEIGITSTPVIDTTTNTIYVLAALKDINVKTQNTTFHQQLFALNLLTGVNRTTPHEITATAHGTGSGSRNGVLTFDPLIEGQRSALLLANGQIYASWASHCDLGEYHGWLMSFNKVSLALGGVFVDTPNGYEGGFWNGGAGLASDTTGSIYAATGNGDFTGGSGGDYGDSILRLRPSGIQGVVLSDYFTPWDEGTLDDNDADVGSGGVLLLPDQPGTPYPHLLVQVGKEGTIDLVNRDNMGHWHSNNDGQIVQTLPYAIGGLFGSPAFWNNNAYFGGVDDTMKLFSFNAQSQQFSTAASSSSPEIFSFPGPTPSISSSGTSNGIVWIVESDSTNAVLRAYSATNLGTELYNSTQNSGRDGAGLAVKFAAPTVADGHVFVGAQNQVAMYGLLQ